MTGAASTRARAALLVAAVLASVSSCAGASSPSAAPSTELTVFAAASLGDALDDVETAYEHTHAVDLSVATGSSAALRTQIEAGAPADVFLSADVDNPQRLVDAGLATELVPFAANAVAVIVPLDNPAGLRSPADLGNDGVRVIGAGSDVPITRYAGELLTELAGLDGYPDRFVARYEANIASREEDVRAVLAKIELAEGDAAIVYATDVAASTRIRRLPIPDGIDVRAVYGGTTIRAGDEAAAREFLDWLAGPAGQALLATRGFVPP